MIYKPPQIPLELEVEAIVDDYLSDYRRMYIERPRLRLDGVYIAVCHYVYVFNYGFRPHLALIMVTHSRPGLSENAWVTVCCILISRYPC